MRLFHLVHRHVDAIEQRRAALGLRESQAVLNFLGLGREALHQFRSVAEFHQKEFILRISRLHELRHRLPRAL